MGALAIIPARGGSKRFPRKNIADFMGRPIICYTIEAALRSANVDRVLVSTDDDEIAGVAVDCGADVHHRPSELGSDTATVVEVCLDVFANDPQATDVDRAVVLYPTAPLRGTDDIDRTYGLLEEGVCEFSMAVTRYAHEPHRALVQGDDGVTRPYWPDLVGLPRTSVPDFVVDSGSTYGVIREAFERERTFYGSTLKVHLMPFERSIDINTPDDLRLLEAIAPHTGPQ